jgi:hypothetical protein
MAVAVGQVQDPVASIGPIDHRDNDQDSTERTAVKRDRRRDSVARANVVCGGFRLQANAECSLRLDQFDACRLSMRGTYAAAHHQADGEHNRQQGYDGEQAESDDGS